MFVKNWLLITLGESKSKIKNFCQLFSLYCNNLYFHQDLLWTLVERRLAKVIKSQQLHHLGILRIVTKLKKLCNWYIKIWLEWELREIIVGNFLANCHQNPWQYKTTLGWFLKWVNSDDCYDECLFKSWIIVSADQECFL